MRDGIANDISEGTVSYIHIFAVLSALKQICNHPAAFLKRPEEYKNFTSGKWDLFLELLSEARESQQKVVIFSQYLAMLDIMELYLNENNIQFATIRGSTIERGKEVERFNKDPQCEVFLGSLQAAGWGIDLTGASVVIHYDRWWNAAREDQATDRVHRIGQTRGVQVFKLVTKGTFEERIDYLISQKGKMMEDVIGFDDHQFIKKFTQEEILQLLQEVKL
jgi:SNF2 family DNA or RNA helicase